VMVSHNFVAVVWNETNEAWEVLTSLQATCRVEAVAQLQAYMAASAGRYVGSQTPNVVWLFPLDGANPFSLDVHTETTLELR